jgi:hypothetical protein
MNDVQFSIRIPQQGFLMSTRIPGLGQAVNLVVNVITDLLLVAISIPGLAKAIDDAISEERGFSHLLVGIPSLTPTNNVALVIERFDIGLSIVMVRN